MRLRLALLACLAAAPASEAQEPFGVGLPLAVEALSDTRYRLHCRFRLVKVRNGVYLNTLIHEGVGPWRGRLPGQNGRCTLTKVSGRGAVTLTIMKGSARRVAANKAGEAVKLQVF
jgi:hypothetical protein